MRNAMKKTQPKTKKKVSAGGRQDFDYAEAKRSAMALFDVSLNSFQRGPNNKWRRTLKPKTLPVTSD